MEKNSEVSEQNLTEGKALHYLCSVMQCVRLSFMIKKFEIWREVMVFNFFNSSLKRNWKSMENDFWKCVATLRQRRAKCVRLGHGSLCVTSNKSLRRFPLKKFRTEQMFLLVRMRAAQQRRHTTTEAFQAFSGPCQGFPTWGTCTPGVTFAYPKGYIYG